MHLQESGEMYLETIYVLSKKGGEVRSVEVGEYMGFSKPSVSRAIRLLKAGGYVEMADDGPLTLTPAGLDVAKRFTSGIPCCPHFSSASACHRRWLRTMPARWSTTSATRPLRPSSGMSRTSKISKTAR